MVKNLVVALLLYSALTACKTAPETTQELQSITYDQMQQQVLKNTLKVPSDLPYYSIDGSVVAPAMLNANLINPIATTWFVNDDNTLVKVHILDVAAALTQLREKTLLRDLTIINCTDIKIVMARLEHRKTIENEAESLNEFLKKQNIEALEYILKTCGFPTIQTASEAGMQTTWNLLQDTSKETRSLYFPQVIEASKNGSLTREDVALMQDKMLMDYDKPQLYGTQLVINNNGIFELYELDKPAQVDARREIMGMPPLSNYLQHFKIAFNVAQKTL